MNCVHCCKDLENQCEDIDYIGCNGVCNYYICNDCIGNKYKTFKNNLRQIPCEKCEKLIKSYYGYESKYYVKLSHGNTRVILHQNIYEIVGCDVNERVLKLVDDSSGYQYCKYGSRILYHDTPPQCSKHSNNVNYVCNDKCYDFTNNNNLQQDTNYIKGVKKIKKDMMVQNNATRMEYLHEDDFNKAKTEAIKTLEEELEKLENKKRNNNTAEIRQEIKETTDEIDKQKRSRYLSKKFKDFVFEPQEVKKKEVYKCGGFDGDNERMIFPV